MIETKEKIIGDATYSVTQLPARRALNLKSKLIKIFGASVTQMLLTATEKQEKLPSEMNAEELVEFESISAVDKYKISELRKSSVVKAIQLLASSIEYKTFEELVTEMTQGVRRNGSELNSALIDQVFAGNLVELYQLIWFILEVNYADFFQMGDIGSLSQTLSQPSPVTKKTFTRA